MTKLTIGIASWENPDELNKTLHAIHKYTQCDFECWVIDNNSQDELVHYNILQHYEQDPRIKGVFWDENKGYVGAVNYLLENAETEYIAYVDNDCEIRTANWDALFFEQLDAHPEIGMIFGEGPGAGAAYPIEREGWTEVLWGIGCFWMLRKSAQQDVGLFDVTLGHQEEVDWQTRMTLAGWKMAQDSRVKVYHNATASTNPEALERINKGIINWVNKWVKYFCGEHMDYYSDNVLRYEDWPPTALYLEEWFKLQPAMAGVNTNPRQVSMAGRMFDMIETPKWAVDNGVSMYRGRII